MKNFVNPPPLSPLPQGEGKSEGLSLLPPPLTGGGEHVLSEIEGGEGEQVFPDETLDEIEEVRIIQKKKGRRFTTDSVLLATLSTPKKYAKVLELGTGCGIVSIVLSKRIPSLRITAVEIQEKMAGLAERNVKLNDMDDSISVLNRDIKQLSKILPSAHFDYIVTNPPYRPPASGRISPDRTSSISNHEFVVTINDIMKVSRYLLKVRGRICIIYIADRLADLFSTMRKYRIEPKEMRGILTKGNGGIKLVWVEGVREGKPGLKLSCLSKHL